MAAPEYVPTSPTAKKHYVSPPSRRGAGSTSRPGETFGQPATGGSRLGAQGPGQGFAITLTEVFNDQIRLTEGEYLGDVHSGCVGVATKRAAMFHRAPVVHDLRIAYTLFGFLDENPQRDLVEFRREAFAEVHYSFHYFDRRAIADLVTEEILGQTPEQVEMRYKQDWRDQLSLSGS